VRPPQARDQVPLRLDEVPDDQAIMQYVPALKDALGSRRQVAG
jgi:hypothetical protein